MAKRLALLKSSPMLAALALSGAGAPAAACIASPLEVAFPSNGKSAAIGEAGAEALTRFADSYVSASSAGDVRIVGLFDTSENADARMRLALRRGRAIQMHLAGRGITPDRLRVVVVGEDGINGRTPAPALVRVFEEKSGPQPALPEGVARTC